MKKINKFLFTLLTLIFVSNAIYSQDRVVYGVVNVFDSIPLIGVEVKVKSTKQSVFTDTMGNFSAPCKLKDKLKLTANGFQSVDVKIDEKISMIAVNMKIKPGDKNRENAIGYGHISEKDRTAAIALLDNTDTEFTRYANMYDLIRSMGVEVTNGEVIIRGNKSFQLSSAALIVVDDNVVESSYLGILRPIEVKSINIIKDGSSAVYGSRGSNGVVLIETKKGGGE